MRLINLERLDSRHESEYGGHGTYPQAPYGVNAAPVTARNRYSVPPGRTDRGLMPAVPPEEIWQAVRFMIGCGYFTGRVVEVDGGLVL